MNVAIAADRAGNALLLGDPAETISQRTARARAAGQRWAVSACWLLTAAARALGSDEDHCTWALEPGTSGKELWHWCKPTDAA